MSCSLTTLSRGLFFALLALGTLCLSASAATLTVPAQYSTIQAAITAAASGDTVLIADGTYTGPGNVDLDFGGKNLTVTSQNGAAKTIIDCGGSISANHRGFYLHSGETNAVISGLTVENGYEGGNVGEGGIGGGILDDGSGLTVRYCVIQENTVAGDYSFGGGIYDVNGNGAITVFGCTILGNNATYGGGVSSSSSNDGGSIELSNCFIAFNKATEAGGGDYNASYSHSADGATSPIIMTNCSIAANTSIDGSGGVYNETDSNSSVITMAYCAIVGNMASYAAGVINGNNSGSIKLTDCIIANGQQTPGSGGGGGGVLNGGNPQYGTTTLTRCAITNNVSNLGNSGLFNDGVKTTLNDCVVTGNISTIGSGILNDDGGTLILSNCVIAGNTTIPQNGFDGYGGGIYNSIYSDTITMINCTVTGNHAVSGGGICNSGLLIMKNDAITGNTQESGGDIYIIGGTLKATFCDIQGGYPGNGNIDANPLFVSSNAPYDFHLMQGSPCLNAGTANGAPTTTIDGYTRPNPPSIGAYETAPIPVAVPAAPTGLTATASGGKITLTWTASGGTVSSYSVYRGTVSGGETFYKTANTSTTFVNSLVTKGTTYYYTIKALNSSGSSLASNEASATP